MTALFALFTVHFNSKDFLRKKTGQRIHCNIKKKLKKISMLRNTLKVFQVSRGTDLIGSSTTIHKYLHVTLRPTNIYILL